MGLSSPTFVALQTGRVGEGIFPHEQWASMYMQLYLHEQQAHVSTAPTNGAHVHKLACCSHKWGPTHARPSLLQPGSEWVKAQ